MASTNHDLTLPQSQSGPTPLIDTANVDHAPICVSLPRVHLAGGDRSYDAHIEVGRHGFSLFLSPTAQYPTLDIDGTREQLERVAQELTRALADGRQPGVSEASRPSGTDDARSPTGD
jgi:hypothetical protein